MPETLESLTLRIRALEDREEIRDLIARYGPLADTGDGAGVAALWQEDGVYAVGGMGESIGRDAIAALMQGAVHQKLMSDGCAHVLSPASIRVDGDLAIACGYSCVFRWTGEVWEAARVSANRWELARSADGWQVVRRENALLNGSETAQALLIPPVAPHPR
jgi:uncharacterized protein (TIGR02246 family)